MKTIKKFRAWKDNRLIPNAIPYSNNEIIVGAKLLNGKPTLKIDKVDSIEQFFSDFYEGDIVAFIDRFDFTIKIGIIGLDEVVTDEGQTVIAECITDTNLTSIKYEKIFDYIFDDPLLIGNIHLNQKTSLKDLELILKDKLNEERKKYDK